MGKRPLPLLIKTEPYPGFPTDLQSPFMAFLATAQGTSYIEEQVFEGRFATAKILEQMGAVIRTEDQRAVIEGHYPLKGAAVNACDLRGGAALMTYAGTWQLWAPISAGWGRTPDGRKKFPQTGADLWQGRMILPGEVQYEKLWQ